MALTKEQLEEIRRISAPDYGVPGSGFDSLRSGISTTPKPGMDSDLDFMSMARQVIQESAKEKRLDDGFRGQRLAKVLYIETKDAALVPDKKFVAELLETLPTDETHGTEGSPSGIPSEITIVYAIPQGGVAASNAIPQTLAGESGEAGDSVDYGRIINYPRFYYLGKLEDIELNPGDYINVEIKDYVEYSYGIMYGVHSASPMFAGGAPPSLSSDQPSIEGGEHGSQRYATGGTKIRGPMSKAKIQYSLPDIDLDNSGAYIGHSTVFTDTIGKDGDYMPKLLEHSATMRINKHGRTPIRQNFRNDVKPYVEKIKKEMNELQIPFLGVGALCTPGNRPGTSGDRVRRLGASRSQHMIGRGFDLHSAVGAQYDWRAMAALKKGGYDAANCHGYLYYIAPNGPRRWTTYAVSPDPAVPEIEILAFFGYWNSKLSKGKDFFFERVKGRFVDLNKIFAKHGFQSIRAHNHTTLHNDAEAECRGENGKVAIRDGGKYGSYHKKYDWQNGDGPFRHLEWWHYQFTADLVRGQTAFGSQLQAIYPVDKILSLGWKYGTAYYGGKGRWDDPSKVYGKHWF